MVLPAQIVRTIPRRHYDFAPDGEFGIRHAYLEMIRGARRLIYLESQYLWSPEVMDALIEAMNRPHAERFRIVLVLPARATSGKWDNDQHVQRLRAADDGRGIVEVYTLYTSGTERRYARVPLPADIRACQDRHRRRRVADRRFGESQQSRLHHRQRDQRRRARSRRSRSNCDADLWAEHLGMSPGDVRDADAANLIDTVWKQRAAENADIVRRRERPLLSQVHRYEPGHMPGAWILDETEALTFEH